MYRDGRELSKYIVPSSDWLIKRKTREMRNHVNISQYRNI